MLLNRVTKSQHTLGCIKLLDNLFYEFIYGQDVF